MSDYDNSDEWARAETAASHASHVGSLKDALKLYEAFLARWPNYAQAHYKRANALTGMGRNEEALAAYKHALTLDPSHSHAFCNLGAVLEKLHRFEEALDCYENAIEIDPLDHLSTYNRANALRQLGRLTEALAGYNEAIRLHENYAEAFVNRGNVLQEMQYHEAAIASYDRAIELKPALAAAFQGRGTSLQQLKQLEAAVASFDVALALNPEQKFIFGMKLHLQMQLCDWQNLEVDLARLTSALRAAVPVSPPHPVLALLSSAAMQRVAAEIWVREECQCTHVLGRFEIGKRRKKLRIAYFSPDFREHPVSQLAVKLFEQHDREKFEITAFAFGPWSDDDMRSRLQRAFDRFVDMRNASDIEAASLARRLEIDIAIDLAGHTEHSRTRIFAMRAAPIQISFLGYPGTMGAKFIDYLIADRVVVPEPMQSSYAEKIIYLPGCYLPGSSAPASVVRTVARDQLGLPKDGFVFCCFNNAYKITPGTFDSWMWILSEVQGSVLWLAQSNIIATRNLRQAARRRGLSEDRLIFADRTESPAEHLSRLGSADLALDTFPYNAHATAMDALRAGVPIITRISEGFAGRVAASLLTVIGLPELITDTPQQYEELCIKLGKSPNLMIELRQRLARKLPESPLFDTQAFVGNLEIAYQRVQERYLKGLDPDHLWL